MRLSKQLTNNFMSRISFLSSKAIDKVFSNDRMAAAFIAIPDASTLMKVILFICARQPITLRSRHEVYCLNDK